MSKKNSTPELYPLKQVEERIAYYNELIKKNDQESLHISAKILSFWMNYRKEYYPNA